MKIVYKPIWGSQERWDLSLVRPTMTCDPHEEHTALNHGWLLYNQQWYLSRSVRVKTSRIRDNIPGFNYEITVDIDRNEIENLWNQYITQKKFSEKYDLWTDIERTKWLLLRNTNGSLVSFTKLVQYNGCSESALNAYIKQNKISIGKRMLELEISIAFNNNENFLYLGPGHEKGSIYKSDLPGFEFWNGESWSTDRIEYEHLCIQDSQISTLSDLNCLWKNS